MTKPTNQILVWNLFQHDMNNKLALISGYTELCMPLKVKKALKSLEEIRELYDGFMKIDHEESLKLEQIINTVNEMLEKAVEIKCQKPEIQLNSLFIPIFYNLITNSIEHSGRTQENLVIRITVEDEKIIFADNGIGIKNKDKIFDSSKDALTIIKHLGKEVLDFKIEETGNIIKEGARFEITFC